MVYFPGMTQETTEKLCERTWRTGPDSNRAPPEQNQRMTESINMLGCPCSTYGGTRKKNKNFSSSCVTNNVSSLIRFRLLWIPFGKQQIENYGSSASLEQRHFTATCQVKCSHIYILQSLSNKTRPSNNRKFMEVYFRLSHCMNVAYLLTLLY